MKFRYFPGHVCIDCHCFHPVAPFLSYFGFDIALTLDLQIHAFYLEFVYFDRRDKGLEGQVATGRAPGVYSENIQTGGTSYGTM